MQLTIPNNTFQQEQHMTATGIMKIELGTAHGLAAREEVTLDNGSIISQMQKTLDLHIPRIIDPYGENEIVATTPTSITINVGVNPTEQRT